jgi:xanthine dehydrogenase YagT iron-sulfur-binding subunit
MSDEQNRPAPSNAPGVFRRGMVSVAFTLNRQKRAIEVEPRAVLLDVLREQLQLTGTKKGCDHGQCGACTVLVNGRRVLSCLSLAAMHDGDEITTVEGLAHGGELHPVQAAFLECDGFQCGACTSGQIMSAVGLLTEPVGSDDASVREAMSGNLCRCGAYQGILEAVQKVRGAGGAG